MAAPAYVERFAKEVYQQPFDAGGVKFYGFVLQADARMLQKNVCDKYLNTPGDGRTDFRPVGPFIMLVFATLNRLQSSLPPDHNKGWFRENEAAFWLLTVNTKNGDLRWFHPFMMVDNAHAFAMGRELYGFAKSMGRCEIPPTPKDAKRFSAHTPVFKKFGPNSSQTEAEIFKVQRHKTAMVVENEARRHGFHQLMKQFAWEYLKDHMDADTPLHRVGFKELIHSMVSIPMIFLKEFRHVEDRHAACYQSLVEVGAQLKFNPLPRAGWLPGDYKVRINSFDSHPFQQTFGLPAPDLQPLASFWATFNFHMGNGKELWRAGVM